jgi:membrane fusion protein (multidrug efflux system)
MQEYVPAVGSFRARQTTQIGSQVSGRVQEMLVDVGDVVKKGQELVHLDPVFFQLEVAQAQARLEAAQAALTDAGLNYNRMKNLWEKPAGQGQASISRKLFDDAKLKFDASTAEVKQGESSLKYSQERLKETIIRAPYNAVVSKRLVDPGEPITSAPATYLLTIQEVDTLDLEFSLPQAMLSSIEIGTPLKFEVEGIRDGKGMGTVATIYPAIDEATRSFRCRAHIQNPNLKFRPGLLAQVQVLKRQAKNTLVLPRQAVTQTATGWEVNVSNNGQPTPKNVNVGLITDDRIEILDGLQPNDQIFVHTGS